HCLIAVIDGRTAERNLAVARRAGTWEKIAAVVEFDVENIQRHVIDVRSVASHVHATKRIVVTLTRMIPRTICRPERSPETGRAPVAVRNRWKEGCGKALRADSVFLPGSLVAAEREQLVLNDRTAQHTAELVLIQDFLFCVP